LVVIDVDGGDAVSLNGWGNDPRWSSDATRIVVWRGGSIAILDADGTQLSSPISQNCNPCPRFPNWSPDGNKIAYTCDSILGHPKNELCVVNADGTNNTRLTSPNISGGCEESWPDWSPDGSKIIYDCNGYPTWSINADGSGQSVLANFYRPGWSPDGAGIVGVRSNEIWVMNADGSNAQMLNTGSPAGSLNGSPRWGP
jgi:Tol biopolymer transport system component